SESSLCHPERSKIVRKANDLAQSRDPESASSGANTSGNSDSLLSLGVARLPGVLVLKLHGSTNWVICPRCCKVHVRSVKFTGDPEAFRTRPCAECREPGLH